MNTNLLDDVIEVDSSRVISGKGLQTMYFGLCRHTRVAMKEELSDHRESAYSTQR